MNYNQGGGDIILVDSYSILFDKKRFSNIGLASIESFLNHHRVNCRVIHISEIDDYVDKSDVFGISVMDHSYALAQKLTQRLQHKTIIWGGWTASALAEFILKENPGIDYVILQEGEKRLLNLLKSFKQPELFDKIDGIAYRNEKNGIIIRPPNEFLNLDDLPIPTNLAILNKLVFVELARGCYGKCRYCQEVHKMRFKSSQKAAEEIEHWYTHGYRYFYLGNSNSLANGELLRELVREIEKRGLHIKIFLVGRPNDVLQNHDILKEIFESQLIHLESIEIGIEANTQHVLDLLGRRTTPEMNQKAIATLLELRKTYSSDTFIHANMILFSHFDMTIEDFVKNVHFIGNYQCSRNVMALQLYGVANTPIWYDMKARGFQQQKKRGLQICDYPFSDKHVNQLFKKLVYNPLQKIKDSLFFDHSEFQRQCHDTIMEFYHSQNIMDSVMNFINSSDDDSA